MELKPDWKEIFIKEAAVVMFVAVYKHQPNYADEKQAQALTVMEQTATRLIRIIQNLFN